MLQLDGVYVRLEIMPPLKQFSDFERLTTSPSPTSASTTAANENNNVVVYHSNSIGGTSGKSVMCEQYAHKLLVNLNALRVDSRFCDVEIIAGGRVFNAHRIVLSASSVYFEAMFRPDLGLCEGKQKSVVLHSIDPNILQALVDFIYTGQIKIEQHNVQELLAAGDMLQIPDVVDSCCDFLSRELHASNALGILRFAETHHCERLVHLAQTFVHANFPQVKCSMYLRIVTNVIIVFNR